MYADLNEAIFYKLTTTKIERLIDPTSNDFNEAVKVAYDTK